MIKFSFLELLRAMDVVSGLSTQSQTLGTILGNELNAGLTFLTSIYAQGRANPEGLTQVYWPEDLLEVVTDREMETIKGRYYLQETDFSPLFWRMESILVNHDEPFNEWVRRAFLADCPSGNSINIQETSPRNLIAACDEGSTLLLFRDWMNQTIETVLRRVDEELDLSSNE